MHKFDVVIIGSGLGGLLCGNILSREGFSVCILEKQSRYGGNLQTFRRGGHTFETGVHYTGSLGPGQTLHRYWKYFGLMEALQLQQLDSDGFDIIGFPGGEFPLAQGFDNFIRQLLPFFPGGFDSLTKYTTRIREVVNAFPLYNLELPDGHKEHHYTGQSAVEFLNGFSRIMYSSGGIPLSSVLAGNNYLFGGDPVTPLHMTALISHSFISGAFRFIGGSTRIADLLVQKIQQAGGTIHTRQHVTAISRSNDIFTLSTASGEIFMADRVISGIHPAATLSMMPTEIIRPAYERRITGLKNTVSSFILYLSLKPGLFPYPNYNYYFHETHDPWNETGFRGEQWPGMFLLTTGCTQPGQEFAETATILTYMQYDETEPWHHTSSGDRGAAYLDFRQQKAERLLQLVFRRFTGLKNAISGMEISTPLTYRDYTGDPEGSLYGIQKNFHEPMLTSVMPRTKVPGFYFTGQNTNLHGLPGVTIGAVATCGEITGLEYLLKKIKNA